jgi:hypothetical protein
MTPPERIHLDAGRSAWRDEIFFNECAGAMTPARASR